MLSTARAIVQDLACNRVVRYGPYCRVFLGTDHARLCDEHAHYLLRPSEYQEAKAYGQ